MTVTEVKQAVGSWSLTLSEDTPREILDAMQYFGHVAIVPGRINPLEYGDNLLAAGVARYVGVLRTIEDHTFGGSGMAFWLGSEDGIGDVFETPVVLTGATFAASVTALLPPGGAVTAGTINSIAGTYTGTHKLETSRKSIGYVTELFGAEWRVNNNGTLDAGTVAQLYRTVPQAIIARRNAGRDLFYTSLPGDMSMGRDSSEFTSRVLLMAEGEGDATYLGSADIGVNPYKDIHGGTAKLTRVISEQDTTAGNADARAALYLAAYDGDRKSVSLSTEAYDLKGDVVVGDYVYVWDPDRGFLDQANEVAWNGEFINPIALRCVEATWPIRDNWTVAYRDINGNWYDLSSYYEGEGGGTSITVGELSRAVTSVGTELPSSRPSGDSSTPATPVFNLPFDSIAYQSAAANDVRTGAYVSWSTPLNVDGSTVLDGDHYEVRVRANQVFNYQTSWGTIGGFSTVINDPFDRTTSNAIGNGWTTSGGVAGDYSTDLLDAKISNSSVNVARKFYRGSVLNGNITFDLSTDKLAVGAPIFVDCAIRWNDGTDTGLLGRVRFDTTGAVGVQIVERIAGVETIKAQYNTLPGLTHVINTKYRLECIAWVVNGTSTQVQARVFLPGTTAPDWQVSANTTTAAVQTTNAFGVRTILTAGNTSSTTVIKIDNYLCTNWGSGFRWNQLQKWGRLLSNAADTADQWKTYYIGWGTNELTVSELMVATIYEFQVRAVDAANPPNESAWSASAFLTTRTDTLAPKQPAPPEVASSLIAVQVTHRLGDSGGGTFNLASDLHHLEVHVGGEYMIPDEQTLVGTIIANQGHITGKIPVVGTFMIENTDSIWVKVIAVDRFGNKSSPSTSVQSSATLIDDQHITSLTASKITAGTITADLLIGGAIKTAEDGQRVEMNNLGIQIFDDEGNPTVNLTADDDTPNFISITDPTLGTLASIDSQGNVQGQTFNAANDIVIAGESFLTDLYDPLPKGLVARGIWPLGSSSIPGAGVNAEQGAFELSFIAITGRLYKVTLTAQINTNFSGTTNEQFTYKLRDGGASTPTLSSTEIFREEFYGPGVNTASGFQTRTLVYTSEFTAGLHRLLFSFFARYGTGNLQFGNLPLVWTVEDIGSSLLIQNTITQNDGSGSGGVAPPITTYTKTYPATWSRSYTGGGNASDFGGAGRCYQGDIGDGNGNRKSMVGFNYAQIMSDLAGATITQCQLKLYYQHWYYDSGGTAVIGTHSSTAVKPSTYPSSSDNPARKLITNWPKPGLKTVDLGTTIGGEFKSGASKGIVLGPGSSSSVLYYGYASGYGESNPPQLIITYTK